MKLSRAIICSRRPLPNILKYWDHQGDIPRSEKKNVLSHIVGTQKKSDFYEPWLQQKQLKTFEDKLRLTRYL